MPTAGARGPLDVVAIDRPAEVRTFIDVPWKIIDQGVYPQWVPPLRLAVADVLDEQANPFYEHASRRLFLARRAGKVVGRIAAIENSAHNRHHGDRVGFFGF